MVVRWGVVQGIEKRITMMKGIESTDGRVGGLFECGRKARSCEEEVICGS